MFCTYWRKKPKTLSIRAKNIHISYKISSILVADLAAQKLAAAIYAQGFQNEDSAASSEQVQSRLQMSGRAVDDIWVS